MKYTILFSLLLVGVCFGKTLEGLGTRQNYNSQGQNYDFQKKNYDSEEQNYDSTKQTYDSQGQNYDSQKQNYDSQAQNYGSQKAFDWQQRDYSTMDSRRHDSDYQSRDSSQMDSSKKMKSDYQRPQKAIPGWEGVKNFFKNIFGGSSDQNQEEEHVVTFYTDEVPSFPEVLEVGSVTDKLALANMNYKNVAFYGLNNASQIIYQTDIKSHQITVTIPLGEVYLKGQYTVSNLLKHTSGHFHIELSGHVAYVHTVSYQVLEGGKVECGASSGQMVYEKANTTYENIGFFGQLFHRYLGKLLMQTVGAKVHEHVQPKLVESIRRQVQEVSTNFHRAQTVSHLQQGINSTYYRIQQKLAASGNVSVQLTGQDGREYQHEHYRAKFVTVTVYDAQNAVLQKNKVFYNDTMVHAYVQLALAEANVDTVISYQSGRDSQNHEVHVQYMAKNITTILELHRELNGDHLQLLNVTVKISEVRLAPSYNHVDSKIIPLVEHSATQLKSYMINSLESYIRTQVELIVSQRNSGKQDQKFTPAGEYSTSGYSGNNQHPTSGYSGNDQHSTSGYSGNDQYPTSGYSGNDQHTTSGYSGNDQYPTSGYSGNDQYPTSGYSGNDQHTTSGYSGNDQYPTSGYSGNDQHPTSGYSGNDQHPTSGYSGNDQHPTSGYSGNDQHPTSGYSGNDQHPTSGYSGNDQHPTSGYSGNDQHPTSGYSGNDQHSTSGYDQYSPSGYSDNSQYPGSDHYGYGQSLKSERIGYGH